MVGGWVGGGEDGNDGGSGRHHVIVIVDVRWLRKNTVFIEGSHITSSPRSRITLWGSNLESLTNELTGTSHMGYFISTAVPTSERRICAWCDVRFRSVGPTLDEEEPMVVTSRL